MKRQIKTNILLKMINNSFYDSLLPKNLTYLYNFGSLLGISLIIQFITGILLAMYYIPNINKAFDSVEYIMREINNGWLIRYIHNNNASFFFILVYIHIFRSLYYNSFVGKRILVWNIGIIIFLLMIIIAFLGYVLPWGSMSLWGATVITNLLSTIPLFGKSIVNWIWGGFSISNATLNRFYSLHYLLPFILLSITIIHIISLHECGSSNPLGIKYNNYINFHSYYTLKDILGFLLFFIFLFIFVYYYPNILNHTDNYIEADPLITPKHIVPEWYLLAFYGILRSIPNKTMGVIVMLFSILSLFFFPLLNNSLIYSSKFKPVYKWLLYLFVFNFLLLLWIGSSVVEYPYILFGQLFTFFYFYFILLIFPLITFLELFILNYTMFTK